MHIPGLPQAGGFTITSTPRDLKADNFIDLAVQHSPNNPPAAWLWQEKTKILNVPLFIRAGGSFVWPPPGIETELIERLVFVAGGVGIKLVFTTLVIPNNPILMEILLLVPLCPS